MSRIQNMRIALLGGRGYIGTQLKKRLLELGRPGFDIVVGVCFFVFVYLC